VVSLLTLSRNEELKILLMYGGHIVLLPFLSERKYVGDP
jgi:hypothetical protein